MHYAEITRDLNCKIDELMESHDIVEQQVIAKVYKWVTDVVTEA